VRFSSIWSIIHGSSILRPSADPSADATFPISSRAARQIADEFQGSFAPETANFNHKGRRQFNLQLANWH
jgi:hypothetical protein